MRGWLVLKEFKESSYPITDRTILKLTGNGIDAIGKFQQD